jgi:hypothetical protein
MSEPIPKTLADLTQVERKKIFRAFCGAAAARAKQWDFEQFIEDLIRQEIDVEFDYYATCLHQSTIEEAMETFTMEDALDAVFGGD